MAIKKAKRGKPAASKDIRTIGDLAEVYMRGIVRLAKERA